MIWAWMGDNQPFFDQKSGRDIIEVTKEICALVSGPVSAEVTSTDADTMIAEGRKLVEIAPNIAVKVPLTWDGLQACKTLSSEGHMVNVTLCFSANRVAGRKSRCIVYFALHRSFG